MKKSLHLDLGLIERKTRQGLGLGLGLSFGFGFGFGLISR